MSNEQRPLPPEQQLPNPAGVDPSLAAGNLQQTPELPNITNEQLGELADLLEEPVPDADDVLAGDELIQRIEANWDTLPFDEDGQPIVINAAGEVLDRDTIEQGIVRRVYDAEGLRGVLRDGSERRKVIDLATAHLDQRGRLKDFTKEEVEALRREAIDAGVVFPPERPGMGDVDTTLHEWAQARWELHTKLREHEMPNSKSEHLITDLLEQFTDESGMRKIPDYDTIVLLAGRVSSLVKTENGYFDKQGNPVNAQIVERAMHYANPVRLLQMGDELVKNNPSMRGKWLGTREEKGVGVLLRRDIQIVEDARTKHKAGNIYAEEAGGMPKEWFARLSQLQRMIALGGPQPTERMQRNNGDGGGNGQEPRPRKTREEILAERQAQQQAMIDQAVAEALARQQREQEESDRAAA